MSRFYVAFESIERYEALKAEALRDGSFSEDHEDWYEPPDLLAYADVGDDKAKAAKRAAKIVAQKSVYGTGELREKFIEWIEGIPSEESLLIAEIEVEHGKR